MALTDIKKSMSGKMQSLHELRKKKWETMQKPILKGYEPMKDKHISDSKRAKNAQTAQPSQEYQRNYQSHIGRAYND
jgi:hypothetical protein